MIIMRNLWLLLILTFTVLACNNGYAYSPPLEAFDEADLVGTWQAKYGTTRVDTIVIKQDGTYQQRFEAPKRNYFYESPWNKWKIEQGSNGEFSLYLEDMRYYGYHIEIGEAGGRHPDGEPALFYDIDENKTITMTDKVVLRIEGNDHFPRGIILRHMHIDLDASPAYFTLVDN